MRYTVLAFLCAITFVAYLQRLALAVPTKVIEGELGLGPDGLGVVMSAFYWGYALIQLPAGWVAERLGSKSALILFAVAWSALTGLTGLATGFTGLLVLWCLMGAAQAGIFPCCTKAIGATFPRDGQAFASGMLACCMSLGAAVSPVAAAFLLGRDVTWQQLLVVFMIPGLAWAVVFALAVPPPDGPVRTPPPAPDDRGADWHAIPDKPPRPVRWTRLVTDFHMQMLCGQQFLRAGAMVFFYTWFPRFLEETKGLSRAEAAGLAAWPPLVGAAGALFGGMISDWLLRRTGNARLSRQGLAFVTTLGCAGAALAGFFTPDPTTAVVFISIGAMCGMSGGVSAYAVAIAYGGKRVATVFATMNMSGNVGAALFPLAVGVIVKQTGNWNLALLLFVSLFAVAAVCWALLNPKGTLFDDAEEEPPAGPDQRPA